jgi:hypothetical protein
LIVELLMIWDWVISDNMLNLRKRLKRVKYFAIFVVLYS